MIHPVFSKLRGGTHRFEGHTTVRAVAARINVTPGCIPLTRGGFNVDFARKFVQSPDGSRIMTGPFPFGREFYSVDIVQEMHRTGRRFPMPAIKIPGEGCHTGRT